MDQLQVWKNSAKTEERTSKHTLTERSTPKASAAVQKEKPTCSLSKRTIHLGQGKKGTAKDEDEPTGGVGKNARLNRGYIRGLTGSDLITKDLVAVTVKVASQQGVKEVIIASVYFPTPSTSCPPIEVERLLQHCKERERGQPSFSAVTAMLIIPTGEAQT
ncbi:hypothetical protein J6590_014156 [Homalodisca vitripennis]|nr:hypothetical protein J6590_014156 [Homalodisca vitripennis]